MIEAVVFNGINSLDFQGIRNNVLRIPEVSRRIMEAQEIWEDLDRTDLDVFNFLASEDSCYLGSIKMKSLAAAIVQVGLFDRYCKRFRNPEYIVGYSKGDSAAQVCVGKINFREMIEASPATQTNFPHSHLQIADEPLLSGMALTSYSVFKNAEDSKDFDLIEENVLNINQVIQDLIDEHEVQKFVNVGPGNVLLAEAQQNLALTEVQILESIDLDPMLNWFWPDFKGRLPYPA